jgi:hypothetical protein
MKKQNKRRKKASLKNEGGLATISKIMKVHDTYTKKKNKGDDHKKGSESSISFEPCCCVSGL